MKKVGRAYLLYQRFFSISQGHNEKRIKIDNFRSGHYLQANSLVVLLFCVSSTMEEVYA